MRSIRVLAVCGVSLAVGLAAPAAAAPAVILTDAQLAPAVLEPSDVAGGGWTAAAPGTLESEPHTQANDIEGGWCGGGTDGYGAGELHAAGSAATILTKVVAPDQPHWFVWETLYSFQPAFGNSAVKMAKSFLKNAKTNATSCSSWMTAGEPINSATPAVVTFPRVGDQRVALGVTTAGDGVTEQTDVVYVRVSNNVAVVHTRILPPDGSLLKKIVKRAVKKLQQVAAAA